MTKNLNPKSTNQETEPKMKTVRENGEALNDIDARTSLIFHLPTLSTSEVFTDDFYEEFIEFNIGEMQKKIINGGALAKRMDEIVTNLQDDEYEECDDGTIKEYFQEALNPHFWRDEYPQFAMKLEMPKRDYKAKDMWIGGWGYYTSTWIFCNTIQEGIDLGVKWGKANIEQWKKDCKND